MIVELLERFALTFASGAKQISGCDTGVSLVNAAFDSPYMTRYFLLRTRWFNVYLHVFERGDWSRDLHDHPWPFVAVILWPGYIEVTPHVHTYACGPCYVDGSMGCCDDDEKRRKYPGMILFRPASWRHRVDMIRPGVRAASLVIVGRKTREWGFWHQGAWMKWSRYLRMLGCDVNE